MYKSFLSVLFFLSCLACFADRLAFKYEKGDIHTVLVSASQEVSVDGVFSSRAETIGRSVFEVTDVESGWGKITAVFSLTDFFEGAGGRSLPPRTEEYASVFRRGPSGAYQIAPEYVLPVLRNLPVFPERELQKGDVWTAEGSEVHDLRGSFSLEAPLTITFPVVYTFLGTEKINGAVLHKIAARYAYNYRNTARARDKGADYPAHLSGDANHVIYWDNERGIVMYYKESFRLVIRTARGSLIEYRGNSRGDTDDFFRPAALTDAGVSSPASPEPDFPLPEIFSDEPDSAPETAPADEILAVYVEAAASAIFEAEAEGESLPADEALSDAALTETAVVEDETLAADAASGPIFPVFEPVYFEADSVLLSEAGKVLLAGMAEVIVSLPETTVFITGYAAFAGTPEGRKAVAAGRARTVAHYLTEVCQLSSETVVWRGAEEDFFAAEQFTAAEKALQRRAEIILLNRAANGEN